MKYNRILLISIDSLGKDYSKPFEKYFNVKYLNYRTTNTWTLPSHMSMLGGIFLPDLYFKLIQVYDIEKIKDFVKDLPTISTYLKKFGFKTKAITGGGFMSKYFGWGGDFDEWISPETHSIEWNGEKIIPEKNEFIFLHTFYVHNWFDECRFLKKQFRENRKRNDVKEKFTPKVMKYAKLSYVKRVKRLANRLSWIKSLHKDILVILTSDHAELFKEDKISFHHGHYAVKSPKIFEVPLLIKSKESKKIIKDHFYDLCLYNIILEYLEIPKYTLKDYILNLKDQANKLEKKYYEIEGCLNKIKESKIYKLKKYILYFKNNLLESLANLKVKK